MIQGTDGGVSLDRVHFAVSYMPAFFMTASMLAMVGFRLDANAHARLRERIGGDRLGSGGVTAPGAMRLAQPASAVESRL